MNSPIRNINTNTKEIVVDWNAIGNPENGNSDVISYSLEFDAGTNG